MLAQDDADPGSGGAVYRGMNNYRDYRAGFRRENTIAAEKGGGAHGPLRGSTAIRMTVRVDYQPDICKDYKETGYCGYGDACKFLHDRGDYKAGYELDREWDEQQKRQRDKLVQDWAAGGGGEGEADEQGAEACLLSQGRGFAVLGLYHGRPHTEPWACRRRQPRKKAVHSLLGPPPR